MHTAKRPYWVWSLDRWNLLVAGLLVVTLLLLNSSGLGLPAEVSQPLAATPAFVAPAEDAALLAGQPGEMTGTAAPNARVRVSDGDVPLGETTADANGRWQLAVPALAPGAHTLTAQVTDADGNVIATSEPLAITVREPGMTAPVAAAPVIKLPQGELKAGTPLTLEGTGTPGSTVTVYDGDQVVGQTTVGPDGTWNLTVSPLALGAHRLIARLLGADGKEQAVSAPVELTVADGQVVVATTAPSEMPAATVEPTVEGGSGGVTAAATSTVGVPAASGTPVATAAVAASVPAVIAPAGGAVQADAPLDLEGTGAPGSTVKVYEGNQLLGEAIVGADGKWKTTLPALAAGAHALIAKLFGADGKLLATSEPLAITVPEVSVAILPVINPLAAEKSATEAPTTLTGTAAPGTLLKLYDGAKLLGEATADASGNWKLTVPRLAAGEHILTAIAYGAGGEVQALSKPLTVIVPEAQPAAGGKTATQSKIGWPPDGSTVVSSRPLMTGRSFPRGVVRVYDGETLLGETIADANGFWSFRPSVALSAGQHVLTAVATSADGQTTEKAPPVTITVRGRTVTLPSWKPLVGATPTFLTPANGDTVNTVQPLFAGTAAPNSSIRLYDGDKVIGEVTVDSDGRWTFRPTAPLSEGEHTITVTLLNADGTESPSKSTVTLTVASGLGTAPATAPLVINALPAATSNSRPALTGQAPSGATVRIYDGDMLLGEVKADPSGVWYFVPAAPLAAGEHVLRFEVVGPDGSKLASADRTLTVNAGATAVTPPKIVAPTLGQAAPGDMLSGTAPAGSQVQIYDGGKLIGGATAGANGKWRFRLPRKLAAGKHEIHVVAVDQSGSPVSQSVIVTIEVSPPRTLPVTGAGSTGA
jgi:hypothetical protein